MVQIPRDLSKMSYNEIIKISGTSSNGSQQFLFRSGTVKTFKYWKSEVMTQPLDAGIAARKQSCLSTGLGKLVIGTT